MSNELPTMSDALLMLAERKVLKEQVQSNSALAKFVSWFAHEEGHAYERFAFWIGCIFGTIAVAVVVASLGQVDQSQLEAEYKGLLVKIILLSISSGISVFAFYFFQLTKKSRQIKEKAEQAYEAKYSVMRRKKAKGEKIEIDISQFIRKTPIEKNAAIEAEKKQSETAQKTTQSLI